MGFLRNIRRIFSTTENFFTGFLMHALPKPRVIKFKGSPAFMMSPSEYYNLKYAVAQGYTVGKDGDEWELAKGGIRFREKKDYFGYVLFDSSLLPHYRSIDFKGKTVLDVGGYVGDTAVLFHSLGARKIIIYEPVEEHIPIIRKNVELNHIDAEILNLGVGMEKGTMEIPYEKLGCGFGRETVGQGAKKKTIVLQDVRSVILGSHADIAKFNCEGCEEAIIPLDNETIRQIPVYIIETHGDDLDRRLLERFREAGYELARSTVTEAFHPLYTLKKV